MMKCWLTFNVENRSALDIVSETLYGYSNYILQTRCRGIQLTFEPKPSLPRISCFSNLDFSLERDLRPGEGWSVGEQTGEDLGV